MEPTSTKTIPRPLLSFYFICCIFCLSLWPLQEISAASKSKVAHLYKQVAGVGRRQEVSLCGQDGKKLAHPDPSSANKYFLCQFISKADMWLIHPKNCSKGQTFNSKLQTCEPSKKTAGAGKPVPVILASYKELLAKIQQSFNYNKYDSVQQGSGSGSGGAGAVANFKTKFQNSKATEAKTILKLSSAVESLAETLKLLSGKFAGIAGSGEKVISTADANAVAVVAANPAIAIPEHENESKAQTQTVIKKNDQHPTQHQQQNFASKNAHQQFLTDVDVVVTKSAAAAPVATTTTKVQSSAKIPAHAHVLHESEDPGNANSGSDGGGDSSEEIAEVQVSQPLKPSATIQAIAAVAAKIPDQNPPQDQQSAEEAADLDKQNLIPIAAIPAPEHSSLSTPMAQIHAQPLIQPNQNQRIQNPFLKFFLQNLLKPRPHASPLSDDEEETAEDEGPAIPSSPFPFHNAGSGLPIFRPYFSHPQHLALRPRPVATLTEPQRPRLPVPVPTTPATSEQSSNSPEFHPVLFQEIKPEDKFINLFSVLNFLKGGPSPPAPLFEGAQQNGQNSVKIPTVGPSLSVSSDEDGSPSQEQEVEIDFVERRPVQVHAPPASATTTTTTSAKISDPSGNVGQTAQISSSEVPNLSLMQSRKPRPIFRK